MFRLDIDVGTPTVLGAAGDEEPLGVGIVLAENEGPVGLAARECRPVATADLLSDERIAVTPEARQALANGVAHAILAFPMVAPGRVIGVLGVVEDDTDARELLAMILRGAGARVTTASSVTEALQTLQHESPHVLVCNIAMPGEDGHALIRRIRAAEGDPSLPAVAVTAFARREDRDRALDAGFDLHMAKPVEPAELVDAVATLASRRAA